MTFKTWKEEFYPISAATAAKKAKTVDGFNDVALVKHSLRKWYGLRDENLKRHGIGITNQEHGVKFVNAGNDVAVLNINYESCALCAAHIKGYDEADHPCETCPLYQARGNFACDDYNEYEDDEHIDPPWFQFSTHDDPEPMIKALEDTLEFIRDRDSSSK